jgi:hypothetical protein
LAFLGAVFRILWVLVAVLGNANSLAFLALLLRVDPVPTLGGDAKKCQQAFLAMLPGKANDYKYLA